MTLLLCIIYLGFISLGLPDSLFGAAWPTLQGQLGVPLSWAGAVTMTISGGTILAALCSDRLTYRFGAGKVTAFSVLLTASALVGFSHATRFWMLLVFAVPLGLGAGAVDAALNNFVALHYSSRHMSWLHCFWGLGASISPYIMGFWLARDLRWDRGYLTVAIIQAALTVLLFLSLPLWKKANAAAKPEEARTEPKPLKEIFRLRGIFYVLFSFLAYCTVEVTAFAWTSTYLVNVKGSSPEDAARFASFFYLGMTLSRFLTGFFADKVGDRRMTKLGYTVVFAGLALTLVPVHSALPTLAGLLIAGFGCGPIYPAVIHATPDVFGRENSQAVVGVQMAFAYTGSTFMPPLFGLLAQGVSISLFPYYMLLFAVLGFTLTMLLYRARPENGRA
ncbi:MAG: MFS transporter [Clostridia bacterium]|nr:MFS transporter [Clostridia bacterium]